MLYLTFNDLRPAIALVLLCACSPPSSRFDGSIDAAAADTPADAASLVDAADDTADSPPDTSALVAISGHVLELSTDAPLTGVDVCLETTDVCTRSLDDGTWTLHSDQTISWVHFRAAGYAPTYRRILADRSSHGWDVRLVALHTLPDETLTAGSVILVARTPDGQAAAGYTATSIPPAAVVRYGREGELEERAFYAGATGAALLAGLPSGSAAIRAEFRHGGSCYPANDIPAAGTNSVLADTRPGSIHYVELECLPWLVTIGGKVGYEDSNPFNGVSVCVDELDGGRCTTTKNVPGHGPGWWEFGNIPQGRELTIRMNANGYMPLRYRQDTSSGKHTFGTSMIPVSPANGNQPDGLQQFGFVAARAVNAELKGLADWTVTFQPGCGYPVAYLNSSCEGVDIKRSGTSDCGSAYCYNAPAGPVDVTFEGEGTCSPLQGWWGDGIRTIRGLVEPGTITVLEARCIED